MAFVRSFLKFLLLLILLFTTEVSIAQTYIGTVKDSANVPLHGANLIAIPDSDDLNMAFSISDEKGRYRLNLEKDSSYVIEISYLGYQKIIDSIIASRDIQKDYTMQASNESLEEVLIKKKMAVVVKEDTTIYRTDIFKTGEERKLREVLNKLPGVEVDREGTITVNGKKVDKLMVDGKTFFTGDSKLAVENIPADAVDEVEVLDNYSEIPFLKGLEDSDKMAMNIKLSEGKKKFAFGDIEVGGGVEDRYSLHPTLFYYSPKTSVNVIGDFNNTGQKSFSMQDYINFEGGYLSLMDRPNASSIYNDDFAQFLRNEDFTYNKNEFGAFNIAQEITSDLDLNAYTIISNNKLETLEEYNITYIDEERGLDEFRETRQNNDLFFTLNKLQLRYRPNPDEDLTYDAYVKTSSATANGILNSFTPVDSTFINTMAKPDGIDFTQHLNYSKQFSFEHTTTLNVDYKYSKNENDKVWLFNEPIFNTIIPFVEEDSLHLFQQVNTTLNQASLDLKHYWVLNNTNHIYPALGVSFSDQRFSNLDEQQLDSGEINSFTEVDFNNDVHYRLVDQYVGFQYKTMFGDLILKPGLFYHYYLWQVTQFADEITNETKPVVLPEFESEYKLGGSEKLRLNYRMRSSFNNASSYANRYRLSSFNRIYRGNENLENQLYHTLLLSYYKFSLFKGINYNFFFNYSNRVRSILNTTILEGINQISSPVYTDLPNETYSFRGSFTKRLNDFRFTVDGNASLMSYSRIVNQNTIAYDSENYGYSLRIRTTFDDLPNLDVGYEHDFSAFGSDNFQNRFVQFQPFARLEYDFLNGFILKADYEYNYYKNQENDQVNRFQIGNASLFYNKLDSAWSFEVEVNNMLDANFRRENSFSEFIVTDSRIYLQPRTVLLKIAYKL